MNTWLTEFESIGDNCEFGFVQEKLGFYRSSLLRWGLLDDPQSTSRLIRTGFEDVFDFENLQPAGSGLMVRDVTAGVAFHSAMRSQLRNGVWEFIASEAERRRVHAEEMQKFLYLRQKFRSDLADGKRIYVAKRNIDLTEADAADLFAAIGSRGAGRLLYLTKADAGHPPGSVELLHGRLAHGRVDRFAPYWQADDVSWDCWETALKRAASLFAATPANAPTRLHPLTGGRRPIRRLPLRDRQAAPVAATAVSAPMRVDTVMPHDAGLTGEWTAYAPSATRDIVLRRALADVPVARYADAGEAMLDARPRPADPFFDDSYFAIAYPEVADAAARAVETEDYFSPPILKLADQLRRADDGRYLVASYAPAQMDVLRLVFAPAFYAKLLGWSGQDPATLWKHYEAHGLPAGVPPSPLFNPVRYRRQIAEHGLPAPRAGEPLALHWVRVGIDAGIVPSRVFDEAFYLTAYPDVAQAGVLGFLHFLRSGIDELRAPTVWFDPAWYQAQGDGRRSERYDDFIATGVHEGRMPSVLVAHIMRRFAPEMPLTGKIYTELVEASLSWGGRIPAYGVAILTNLYVPEWHAGNHSPLDGFIAYLRDGIRAGTRPGPLFDDAVYRQRAAAAGLPPFEADESAVAHWLRHGHEPRIVPTDRFDEAGYLKHYPDIKSAGIWGFAHFAQAGVHEGRSASAGPMFRRRETVDEQTEGTLPSVYRYWHTLDFPDRPSGIGDEIPRVAHKRLHDFLRSSELAAIFAAAQKMEPAVGEIATITEFLLPPYYDSMALRHADIRQRLPATHYDSVVCVPWIRTGGADLVAGLLAKALLRVRPDENILVLRTDNPAYERANWLPAGIDVVDISDHAKAVPTEYSQELLRTVLRGVTARRVLNVNSRLCWDTLRDHGANLAMTLRCYAYMFCWDQTPSGVRVGYPAEFFAETAPHVTAFLTDTNYLRRELTAMYRLPAAMQDRIVPMFTPAQSPIRTPSIARVVERRAAPASRKLVLWAGRLDRQKRFDLVQEIARLMPDVTFRCWGAALLDAPPDLAALPDNIAMEGSFDSFDDLPLDEAGAWLFTALWEGMPTTIIELATRGVPIVASDVGGVAELIQAETGWLVPATASAGDYVADLRDALASPAEARRRAEALQRRAADIYNEAVYDAALWGACWTPRTRLEQSDRNHCDPDDACRRRAGGTVACQLRPRDRNGTSGRAGGRRADRA